MKITTIGMDLAKSVFQVHGAEASGKAVLRKQLRRAQVLEFFANLPPCVVAMEACGSAHYWARKLQAQGHEVMLIPPQYVKPYVKRNKNDVADAEAICEAATRPEMPTVPIKTAEQQAILSIHRARQGFVKARTAQANQIRGLLAEFGFAIPPGIRHVPNHAEAIAGDDDNGLPGRFRNPLWRLTRHFHELDEQVKDLDTEILLWHQRDAASQRLASIPGIGPVTASALSASVGDARNFKNGRQLAAWLGLVPRQHSSGGKPTLLGISKRGDTYLRTLLIHGARAVVRVNEHRTQPSPWLRRSGACLNVGTRMSSQWHWPTRTPASRGRYCGTRPTTNRATADNPRRHDNVTGVTAQAPTPFSTDCTGNHEVMAQQVRPKPAKPTPVKVPRARYGDEEPACTFHQGQAQHAPHKVRIYGCNLDLKTITD